MIRTGVMVAAAFLVLAGAGALRADLAKAKAERNLGKRSRLALDNANAQLRAASQAYKTGASWERTAAALNEVRESVDLAYAALKETGKKPRQSGDYKNLELKTRALLKNFRDFLQTLGVDERDRVAPMVDHVEQVHDEVLESIMDAGKGKR
jgi:vacuolar-type H+-ATPase subunit E/Vma4